MSNDRSNKGGDFGYQPSEKGHQPIAVAQPRNDQAGHQPTGSGGSVPRTPPSQGGSGKK